jgi:hypothetical protein
MVTAPPAREVSEQNFDSFAADSGISGSFLADQLSAFIAHERMGVNLVRTLHARSNNPKLRSDYNSRLDETMTAIGEWEQLIESLGGSHQYVSPAGRAVEALDNKAVESLMLSGSTDPMTFEQAGLQAYLQAADTCVRNVQLLAAFAHESEQGNSRDAMERAVGQLQPTAAAHAEWASNTLEKAAVMQAKHPIVKKAGDFVEKAADKIRNAVRPN